MQTLFGDESVRWPPDYRAVFQWRQEQVLNFRKDRALVAGALEYYRTRPVEFLVHWTDTYDPRLAGTGLARMPFILFKRQREMVEFLYGCLTDQENGLIEKCRDMGATWVGVGFSVWLWLFWKGSAVGWGSRKEPLVDRLGDPDSIFEKIRMMIEGLPSELLPVGFIPGVHMSYMRIVNPATGSTITGEVGDNIGRGGRKLIYFKDESAHYVRPKKIEAALGDNTRVQIDISSVNGFGNIFHLRRDSGVDWEPGREIAPGRTRVLVLDWRDHPEKDQEWYDKRRTKAEGDGLLAVFAQEVDRDYSASVEGTVIQSAWITAAIDADIALGFGASGPDVFGLDVADEGGDTNALIGRKGSVATFAAEWGKIDVGATTRKSIGLVQEFGVQECEIHYDAGGLGGGVRSEYNRLKMEEPENGRLLKIVFEPWSAAYAVLDPKKNVVRGDPKSPINEDFFANYKAQAWWAVARRFENTFRAVNDKSLKFSEEELISIPSDLPYRKKLEKELAQPVRIYNSNLKLIIDKKPEGTKSPNLAEGFIQAFCPYRHKRAGLL